MSTLKRTLSVGVMVVGILGAVPRARAEDEQESPYRWKPKVTSVTVFKNGLGFFLRQGKVALRDGWCVSEAVPPAAFGTLAVYSHAKDETVDIVSTGPGEVVAFDGVDAPQDAASKRARLESCKFLKLQLTYRELGADRSSVGQLVSVGPEYVVLQADTNSFAVPLEGIRKLQVLEKPLRVHVSSDGAKVPGETTLGMAYLRKGVTWIPEYTLTLRDEDTAELTLRGTLVNEAEDIVHGDVNFVVGVPHFLHTDLLAPLAVGQVIRTIGAAVAPREVMTQIMNRAAVATDVRAEPPGVVDKPVPAGGRDLKEATGNLPQWDGAGASDFTVYTRKDLTLRLGEKAVVTLFVKRIKYGHVYRWSPPNDIEHLLVLHNDTDTPWTTGPCLTTSEGNALSEDLLKYVPKGGKGEVPVTTAINLAHDQSEAEVERKLKAHQPSGDFFLDLVTLDGELILRNFGKKPSEVIVDLRVQGKPLSASDGAKIVLDTANLKLAERTATVKWNITVKSSESKTLTYRYERYVPSR
ncbi:MAG: hypothetical protein NTW21_09285 [Verrucomicrobia bacterium]|nr:hypothetical protein [Verrucomicrobiota bacterium]